MLVVDVVCLLVLMVDMSVQLNAGYITRGAIIINRQRVVNRYLHYYIYFDGAVIALVFGALVSQNYYVNYAKLIIFFKFMRMFQMNDIIERKLSTHVMARTVYVIGKQIISIFVLSHLLGLGFWVIDNVMVNEPICQDNSNRNCSAIQSAGSKAQQPTPPSTPSTGKYSISTRSTGASTPSPTSVTGTSRPTTSTRPFTAYFPGVSDLSCTRGSPTISSRRSFLQRCCVTRTG